ncbi:unnamed protein product [Clavelina lepadiformis]|uniref:Uncharacterized protein n=1 Tax=Clavelina lepadiformis TaxID=159417 RepID=A0ABP0F3H9_CLALP
MTAQTWLGALFIDVILSKKASFVDHPIMGDELSERKSLLIRTGLQLVQRPSYFFDNRMPRSCRLLQMKGRLFSGNGGGKV